MLGSTLKKVFNYFSLEDKMQSFFFCFKYYQPIIETQNTTLLITQAKLVKVTYAFRASVSR
jgi:hypothetical protein